MDGGRGAAERNREEPLKSTTDSSSDIAEPTCKGNDVLVEVYAAGLNFFEYVQCSALHHARADRQHPPVAGQVPEYVSLPVLGEPGRAGAEMRSEIRDPSNPRPTADALRPRRRVCGTHLAALADPQGVQVQARR